MKTEARQNLSILALACAQLAGCGWLPTSASAGENPVDARTLQSAIIKDGFGPVYFLRYSPSGLELARQCMFGPVVLFDTASYKKGRTFPIELRMVAYSPDGTMIATAEGTDGARVWDAAVQGKRMPRSVLDELYVVETPLQVLEAPRQGQLQRVFWTEFSPDGKRLITTRANGHVKVWNTSSWVVEDEIIVTSNEVRAASFSPDGKTLVIGDTKGMLHRWSFEDKAEKKPTHTPSAIAGIVFAPDGEILVTTHAGSNSTVMIWTPSQWGVAKVEGGFGCAAFAKDGKILALGGRNIKLTDPVSQKEIRTIELPEMTMREVARGFGKEANADKKIPITVHALAFSPDGSTLAAGCRDGTVRLVKINR